MSKAENPFVIEQLEEALEERQTPDRRKADDGFKGHSAEDRRKQDRRAASQTTH